MKIYSYTYDKKTGGILLNSSPTGFSKEPRPVYAPELDVLGFDKYWNYDKQADCPYMWAEANNYYYRGTLVAKLKGGNVYTAPEIIIPNNEDGNPIFPEPNGLSLRPIDIETMVEANSEMLEIIEQTTVKKILAIYTKYKNKLDCFHVAFSGGKDSCVLLDLVKKALPKGSFVVVFGDTGMEFPDTYDVIEITKQQCVEDEIPFYIAKSHLNPQKSWVDFAKNLTESQLRITPAMKQSAKSGISQTTSGVVVGIEKNILSTVWKVDQYWENPTTASLPISKIKVEVDRRIEMAVAREGDGQISIGEIYDFLEDTYGFAPCNLSAFIAGFLFKEYGMEPFRYNDSSGGHEPMTQDKLAEMLGNYIGKSPKPTYIVKMTAEEMAFYELTEKAWSLPANSCSSAGQAAIAVSKEMRELQLPVWCLEEVDTAGIFDIIQKYIELIQKEGNESHKKAVEIGKIASSKPSLADNMFALLTKDNCQKGMREYLRSFEGGKIMELAIAIGAENNILADIRRLFGVKHSCLWDKQTGEDEIRKLLTEYSVVKESNAILNTVAHSLNEVYKEWRERLKFIGISFEALRVKLPSLAKIVDTLLKIYKQEDILPEQLTTLHIELMEQGVEIRELLNNDRRIFAEVYEVYLEDLSADDIAIVKTNVGTGLFELPKTDCNVKIKEEAEEFRKNQLKSQLFQLWKDKTGFVVNSRIEVAESIYKLTDNTMAEREEILAWLSNNGLISGLENIYPILAAYLKKYIFKCSELADLLTDYFEAYKRQKLSNRLEPEFLEKVDELALSRQFNRLPTRDEILNSMNKQETYLYWLDSLGVEYLSLIETLVQKKGLSVHISVARAELPTITSINKGFFDSWKGRKEKNNELDDTKHNDAGGYNFINNELPIHLAKELDIITAIIDKAATELALRHCKRFLIVSDHGASRLAVLCRKEEKYNTDTSGEHSGRCCKVFEPHDLPFAAVENGYLVLADYGRFKGSRAANVEVHGGASLEEVVVPIIELSLKDQNITVKMVNEIVTVDFRTGTEINLFLNTPVQNASVILNGKSYQAVQIDDNHYSVKLADTKRAGDYPADVYAGDDLIGKILIKAQGKSGKVNDAFDDLF